MAQLPRAGVGCMNAATQGCVLVPCSAITVLNFLLVSEQGEGRERHVPCILSSTKHPAGPVGGNSLCGQLQHAVLCFDLIKTKKKLECTSSAFCTQSNFHAPPPPIGLSALGSEDTLCRCSGHLPINGRQFLKSFLIFFLGSSQSELLV